MPSETPANLAVSDEQLIQLGKFLEDARKDAGLSAREVADAAGISPAYLRAIERGSNPKTSRPSRPSPDALRGVARTLGLDAADVLARARYDASLASGPPSGGPARGGVDDLVRQIQEAARGLNRRSPFMAERAREQLKQLTAEFRLMAEGTLRCQAEDEPHLTRLAVQQCESHLRAVSYEDESWWESGAGDRYLELHEDLKRRGVEMTRIFIIECDTAKALRHTLERHVALDIDTYVLSPDEVGERFHRDFVIYDDSLLREADSTDPTNDRKEAVFTDDPWRVNKALLDFNELRTIARSNLAQADLVLSRMGGSSDADLG